MALRLTRPLNPNLPMVDERGRPTPFFMRWIQEQSDTNTLVVDLTDVEVVSGVLDIIGSTWGDVFFRGETLWTTLPIGAINQVLKSNGPGVDPSWGAFTFPELDDTPNNYVGFADQLVKVNAGETGLEFIPAASVGATTFVGLTDTPSGYPGEAQKIAAVNPGETAMEFITGSAFLDAEFGSTRGSILYRGASGWNVLAPDTATTPGFLQSGGVGADPLWATPSGGGGGGATSAAPFIGFRAVRASSTQAIGAFSITDVVCNSEIFDTEAAFDTTTGQFTVPASLNGRYMIFSGGVGFSSGLESADVFIEEATGGIFAANESNTTERINVTSGPVQVATGEVYSLQIRTGSASTVASNNQTFFSGYVIEAALPSLSKGADITATGNVDLDDFGSHAVTRHINTASNITLTVQSGNSFVGAVNYYREGSGTVTFAAGAGVTIQSESSLLDIAAQYQSVVLTHVGSDVYRLEGPLA